MHRHPIAAFALLTLIATPAGAQDAPISTSTSTTTEVEPGALARPRVTPCFHEWLTVDCASSRLSSPRGSETISRDGEAETTGSIRAPRTLSGAFRSISDALAFADRPGVCGVTVSVAPGTCVEDVSISQPTNILGATPATTTLRGTISNLTASRLELHDFTIEDAGEPGAVIVWNPAATTVVNNMRIEGATGAGIYQNGGFLDVHDLTVLATQPAGSPAGGVHVAGGADAVMDRVAMSGNHVSGLVVRGSGTRAIVSDLAIINTWHPGFDAAVPSAWPGRAPGRTGAIEVRDGALLGLNTAILLDNAQCGVLLADGASARLENITVHGYPGIPDGILTDMNVMVIDSVLEISHFALRFGQVGLNLLRSHANASHGEIAHNIHGVGSLQTPSTPEGYEWLACMRRCPGDSSPGFCESSNLTVDIHDNTFHNVSGDGALEVPPAPCLAPADGSSSCPPPEEEVDPDPLCIGVSVD